MIQIFSNTLGEEEVAAVRRAFDSRWVGRGEQCKAFEQEFAAHVGAERVLLFNCCTSATYAALYALDIPEGSEVIVPTVQFVGVANAIIERGAVPVFADVDPRTLNILPSEIERLRSAKTSAVFLLHYGGHPAPMYEVWEAASGSWIIEDAANAVSSTYHGRACGTLGHAGVWSFDAMKELVMADGGALWLRQEWDRAERWRYFGLPVKGSSGIDSAKQGASRWWEFSVVEPSGRHISNDVLASVGRVQLKRLDGFIQRRREVWQAYQEELGDVIETPPEPMDGCESSYYLYWVQTDRRDELALHLRDNGVYTTFRYYPLHLVKAYGSKAQLPNAERAAERTLCLPLHQNLADADVCRVIELVRGFFNA